MMSVQISFERILSMPAFEGVRAIRIQRESQPQLPLHEIVLLVQKVDVDAYALDLEAAERLIPLIPAEIPNEGPHFYRGCLSAALLEHKPVWLRILTQGRKPFLQKLGRDEYSLFRQADLLADEPDENTVLWWDRITGLVRLDGDKQKSERSRRAERLTLELEKKQLTKWGIELKPIWMGLEDNRAGYDVLSYEPGYPSPTNKLIEVKSTIASPLRFYLTRNEWDKAVTVGSAYCFHIWDLNQEPPILYVRTVNQVAPHVPADSVKGKWQTAMIPVGI